MMNEQELIEINGDLWMRPEALERGEVNSKKGVITLFKLSKRQQQYFRDNRKISFTKFGRDIYYKLNDVLDFFEKSYKIKSA